ncbi:MAG: hypothetical protein JXR52_04400 [Bacteroidales bacterium]|nr:hypothetical protein [Bacteroidales bacterium]
MKPDDRYDKIIRRLAENRPELDDREALTDRIMQQIGKSAGNFPQRSFNDYAFSWVGIGWLRSAMAAAATIFIGLFIYQQVLFNHRIRLLEEQLVNTVNTLNRGQEMGIQQKLLIESVLYRNSPGDSITVSRDDLETLMKAWMKAENIDEHLLGDPAYKDHIRNLIRSRLEEPDEQNNSLKNFN